VASIQFGYQACRFDRKRPWGTGARSSGAELRGRLRVTHSGRALRAVPPTPSSPGYSLERRGREATRSSNTLGAGGLDRTQFAAFRRGDRHCLFAIVRAENGTPRELRREWIVLRVSFVINSFTAPVYYDLTETTAHKSWV